mmetsp:Transcript_63652/g.75317  ORF Transcript_63652/g.75317 Transcript_63652/m.75317 type:complete len:219 (-) Transcript_63652:60-716(-)
MESSLAVYFGLSSLTVISCVSSAVVSSLSFSLTSSSALVPSESVAGLVFLPLIEVLSGVVIPFFPWSEEKPVISSHILSSIVTVSPRALRCTSSSLFFSSVFDTIISSLIGATGATLSGTGDCWTITSTMHSRSHPPVAAAAAIIKGISFVTGSLILTASGNTPINFLIPFHHVLFASSAKNKGRRPRRSPLFAPSGFKSNNNSSASPPTNSFGSCTE